MTVEQPSLTNAEISDIARRRDRSIVLVGLMGVGKSTIGRKVAALLGTDFVDADDAIEQAAQMSISDMFDRFGESHFRDGERRVIARLVEEGHGVIATGGGAFCNDETRALILEKAIAVWLDCDIDTLVQRTSRKNNRPLLRNRDPREVLEALAEQRIPFYSQAPVKVRSSDGPQLETAMAIVGAIDQWL